MPREWRAISLIMFAAACSSDAGRAVAGTDSARIVAQARSVLPSDTGGSMHIARYERDSAGTLIDFEVTPAPGFIVRGGGILVRVPTQGKPAIIVRSR